MPMNSEPWLTCCEALVASCGNLGVSTESGPLAFVAGPIVVVEFECEGVPNAILSKLLNSHL